MTPLRRRIGFVECSGIACNQFPYASIANGEKGDAASSHANQRHGTGVGCDDAIECGLPSV